MTGSPHDPLYGVTRIDENGARDVIVRWSEMTPAEQAAAWRDYEKAFGPPADKKDSK